MTLRWKTAVIGTGALIYIFASPSAAGRYCVDSVESGTSKGETQKKAVEAAQGWWSSRAGALGRGYESWDNAADRALECGQDNDGTFHCKATARPCLPEGKLPTNVPKIDM